MPTPLVALGCSCCAATIPSLSLCLSSLHSVHPFFTASITPSQCPSLIQGQLRAQQTWACKAHVLLWHSQGRRGTQSTNPSLLPLCCTATLPVGQPTTLSVDSSVEAENAECSVLPCPHNGGRCGTSWNMLPSYEPLTQTGAPGTTPPQGHLAQVYRELLREPQHTLHG